MIQEQRLLTNGADAHRASDVEFASGIKIGELAYWVIAHAGHPATGPKIPRLQHNDLL